MNLFGSRWLGFVMVVMVAMLFGVGLSAVNATSESGTINDITGAYSGEIRSGTDFDACRIVFSGDTGQFQYREDGADTITTGVVVITDYYPNTKTAQGVWRDRYGSGKVVLTFYDDFKQFSGLWGDGNSVPLNSWRGKRSG